jgi:SAM-dependent methyltransferase
MSRILNIAKWGVTLGSEPQNFLGARWIRSVLSRTSKKKRRIWALRMLSLSPHYFLDPENPKYAEMSNDEYLEAIFDSYVESRKEIYKGLLADRLNGDYTVVDYGCGPGFLSKLIAENVNQVYGCDISEGALACAEILNSAQNLSFIRADDKGMIAVADESVDIVFSYAMVQHLSDEVYEYVLENCRRKLKAGGRLILHIRLDDPAWKTEKEWKADSSIRGRLKFKYGLHCFAKTAEAHKKVVERYGFTNIAIDGLSEFLDDDQENLSSEAILTAVKT